jgi:RHS repeat-associated protein
LTREQHTYQFIYSKDPQTGTLEILNENHYYPFGLKHGIYAAGNLKDFTLNGAIDTPILEQVRKTEYNYKYNGKELQDELGFRMYDYGWRNYDPAIGRWVNVDPLAEKYRRWSPFTYAVNNPIRFIDPDGMRVVLPTNISRSDRRQIMRDLRGLTNDKLSYNKKSGEVNIRKIGEGSKPRGTELVRNVISNDRTTTIMSSSDGKNKTDPAEPNKSNLKEDGVKNEGSNAVVSFGLDNKMGGGDISGGNTRPTKIGLGHELSHAERIMDGTSESHIYPENAIDPDSFYQKPGGISKEEIEVREVENTLREENNVPARLSPIILE